MTTAEDTTPAWVTEGAKVAIYSLGNFGASVTLTTIERLTATQVVCANGRRFRRNDTNGSRDNGLCEVGDIWGPVLLPIGNRSVRHALAKQWYHKFVRDVEGIFKERPDDIDTAIGCLDRITALAAEARANIAKLDVDG